jgi:hypothetical protein
MWEFHCSHVFMHVYLYVNKYRNISERVLYCTLETNALQRHDTENLKQIFPGKELSDFSLSFHIHVSVSDLYIPTIHLPILLQENMLTDSRNI